MSPYVIIWPLIIASAIWVGIDASNLDMRRGGLGGGFLDMGPAGWVFACLLLWIVAFPCYLATRGKYQRRRAAGPGYGAMPPAQAWGPTPMPYGGVATPAGQQYFASAHAYSAPPQVSPDGRWWWDGQRWNPMPAAQQGHTF